MTPPARPRPGAGHPPTERSSTVDLLDSHFGPYSQGYELANIVRLDNGLKVRVRVKRDSYEVQSYAKVEVLTPAMTWTEVLTEAPALWHPSTPAYRSGYAPRPGEAKKAEAALGKVAVRLLDRAAKVLTD